MFSFFLNKFNLDLRPSNIISKPEFKHSVWLLSAQAIVTLTAFALTYALANYVQETEVGTYRFLLSLYASISIFALWGMGTALNQAVAAGKSGSYETAVVIKTKFGFIGTILFFCIAGYYFLFENNLILALSLLLLGLILPKLEAYLLYSSYLNGASKFKESSLFLLLDRLIVAIVSITVALIDPRAITLIAAYLVTRLIISKFFYNKTLKIHPPNSISEQNLLPYAKHITAMSSLGAITSQIDKFILFYFFGPVALAKFWIASVIPQEVGRVVSLVCSSYFPKMVQSETEHALKTVKKLFFITSAGTVLLAILYYLIAPFLFSLLLPKYVEMIVMSTVLMFSYAVIPHLFVWNIFTAKKMLKELYWYYILEPLLVVVLYILLIPLFGVWGLVYALCLRTLIMNIVGCYVLYSYFKV